MFCTARLPIRLVTLGCFRLRIPRVKGVLRRRTINLSAALLRSGRGCLLRFCYIRDVLLLRIWFDDGKNWSKRLL